MSDHVGGESVYYATTATLEKVFIMTVYVAESVYLTSSWGKVFIMTVYVAESVYQVEYIEEWCHR